MKMVKWNPATWLRLILPIILLTGAIATAQPPTVGNVSGTRKDSTGVPVNDPAADRLKADRAAKEKKIKEAEDQSRAISEGISKTSTLDLPSGTPPFITDSLDAYVRRGMKQWEIPGLAIVIVKDGKVILSKGFGQRSMNSPEPVDENTLFIIASNTKLFTGTDMALLEYQKKISLNDKVTKYLPWFRLYDSSSTRLATIRDMLSHRIGLKTFQGDFTFWNSSLPKDSIIWKMRYLKPSGEFRQDYGYCNSGFVVAGRILEKVAGKSWEAFTIENILTPLGMDNTWMNTANITRHENVAYPHNNLYGPLEIIPFDKIDNMGPATSMVSNVKDLAKWIQFQLDSGKHNGRQVIPWEVLQKTRDINILTGSRKSPYYPTHFRGYGLGLYSTDYNGRQVYWHTGGAFGQVTNVCFIPEEKLGIAILTNNDNQSFFEALRYQVLDAYLNVAYTNRSDFQWNFFAPNKKRMDDAVAALNARADKKNTPEIKLADFTGTFYNTVYGKMTISVTGNQLLCRFQQHPELIAVMDYMDNNEFRIKYSNHGYGVYPAKFSIQNGKPFSVQVQANEFVESDTYLFVRDPKAKPVK